MTTRDENIEKGKAIVAQKIAERQRTITVPAPAEVNAGKPPAQGEKTDVQDAGIVKGGGVAAPLESIENLRLKWAKFTAVKAAVIDAGDICQIERNGKKEAYIVKAGWRKIAVAYGLRCEIMEKERLEIAGKAFWNIRVRATAPNGAYAEAIGSCNSGERNFAHGESDILMTAQTRATNRAISDVVGGGDVSAEEMS